VDDKDAHETLWFLENIVGHRLNHDKRKYSVKVRWSTKEETWEPLDTIAVDDPLNCAKYAKENDLLKLPGWKRFKRLAAREKKFTRMLRQAHASKKKNATKYMFGVKIPRNYQEALAFDKEMEIHYGRMLLRKKWVRSRPTTLLRILVKV